MKSVCFITMRPNRGATGGPGGVLYLIQQALGRTVGDIRCHYIFQPIVNRSFKGKRDKLNWLLFKLYFTLHPHTYYVVHDICTARLLAKMHRHYSLVFHQQGPIVQEKMNFGEKLSAEQVRFWQEVENTAFSKAISVHFPSKGAEKMYFDNMYASCDRNFINVGAPLYNTIPEETATLVNELKKEEDTITFFSLGTLTEAKGQDRTVSVIERYIQKSHKKVRYIIVGNGPLAESVCKRCSEIAEYYKNFEFIYYPKLTHSEVLYIHSISDVYIMLHRISIFDFATLEAMQNGCALALSPIGGNLDFNVDDNVLFLRNAEDAEVLSDADIAVLKQKNKDAFEKFFSLTAFRQEYIKLIKNYFSAEPNIITN